MNYSNIKSDRLHALDSLRSIMMLLGLVIHSAISYGVIDYGADWPIKDSNATHISMDYLVFLIHIFRIPIFFVISGFFGAMLFYDRSPLKMIQNRIKRILFPFLVFLLLLWPAIYFSFSFTSTAFYGNEDITIASVVPLSKLHYLIPATTFHLWFLYYLLLFTISSFILGLLLKNLPFVTSKIKKVFSFIMGSSWLRLIFFSLLTCSFLFGINSEWLMVSTTDLVPNIETFIFYLSFYLFGWLLNRYKSGLNKIISHSWLFTCLGIALITFEVILYYKINLNFKIIINAIAVWSFIFGITGLFLRYYNNYSSIMRYNSDASYWIYLIHLPLIVMFQGFISAWKLPAILKFLIVLIISYSICIWTYKYFVRGTFIGQFLNGRKYPRKI